MRMLRFTIVVFLILASPATLRADIGSLPPTTRWYVHADFDAMRSTPAGRHVYGWLRAEVFNDLREDAGVDLDKEADTLTAWSTADRESVIVVDGSISQETQDKLLAIAAATGSLDRLGTDRSPYYFVKGDGTHDGDYNTDVDAFDDGAYFTFAVSNKLIAATSAADLEAMIRNQGRIDAQIGSGDALFVIRAERSLMQAGVRPAQLGSDSGWDSNILRNTEQAALVVADEAGKLAIEAQLVTAEKAMADSLASIVRGLISLQVFNDEIDAELATFLQSVTVDVDDKTLRMKVALDPELVVATLE